MIVMYTAMAAICEAVMVCVGVWFYCTGDRTMGLVTFGAVGLYTTLIVGILRGGYR